MKVCQMNVPKKEVNKMEEEKVNEVMESIWKTFEEKEVQLMDCLGILELLKHEVIENINAEETKEGGQD